MPASTLGLKSAISLARSLTLQNCSSPTPVDLLLLAKKLGVDSVEPAPLNIDGFLARLPNGTLAIRYRSANSDRRNRFTIAHELGHILLAEAQGKSITESRRELSRNPVEETAVNRIASELLMPEHILVRELVRATKDSPWQFLQKMRHALNVSESAITLRMLELWSIAAVLIRLNLDLTTSAPGSMFPIDTSEHRLLQLACDPRELVCRLRKEFGTTRSHQIAMALGGRPVPIVCDGQMRRIPTRGVPLRQYWMIGWIYSDRRTSSLM